MMPTLTFKPLLSASLILLATSLSSAAHASEARPMTFFQAAQMQTLPLLSMRRDPVILTKTTGTASTNEVENVKLDPVPKGLNKSISVKSYPGVNTNPDNKSKESLFNNMLRDKTPGSIGLKPAVPGDIPDPALQDNAAQVKDQPTDMSPGLPPAMVNPNTNPNRSPESAIPASSTVSLVMNDEQLLAAAGTGEGTDSVSYDDYSKAAKINGEASAISHPPVALPKDFVGGYTQTASGAAPLSNDFPEENGKHHNRFTQTFFGKHPRHLDTPNFNNTTGFRMFNYNQGFTSSEIPF